MCKKSFALLSVWILLTMLSSCQTISVSDNNHNNDQMGSELDVDLPVIEDPPYRIDISSELDVLLHPERIPSRALSPKALVYKGAFRLPDDSGGMGWEYSGHGMTYYPDGDLDGEVDNYPGSLFIVGHDQQLFVGEVNIPVPIISRDLEALNTAITLQELSDISGGAVTDALVIPRMGIEYLPPVGDLKEGKLHFAIGQHIQGFEPSHGWASTDLASPNSAGLWIFNGFSNYATNDYLFAIPEEWARTNNYRFRLASGRFREGVWGGLGPALFAYAPWEEGNPPPAGYTLKNIKPLLLYGQQIEGMPELVVDASMRMRGYGEGDHWWGGAWLTSSMGDSVIFTGTKAMGKSWYGFANGVVWDYACTENPDSKCPEIPDYPYDNRGFWAEDYFPAVLFFDPDDLAKVLGGEMAAYEPQPYALLDLSEFWFDPEIKLETYKRDLVGAAAFDRDRGLLFIIERLGDESKSIVHVFQIGKD
jgi:hypothetical protein